MKNKSIIKRIITVFLIDPKDRVYRNLTKNCYLPKMFHGKRCAPKCSLLYKLKEIKFFNILYK